MVPPGPRCPRRPTPLVMLPCGSRSTTRMRWSASARDAARLMAVVVFPTPPFWFVTAMMRPVTRLNLRLGHSPALAFISGGKQRKDSTDLRGGASHLSLGTSHLALISTQMFHVEHWSSSRLGLRHDDQAAPQAFNQRIRSSPTERVDEIGRVRTARTAEPEHLTARAQERLEREERPRFGAHSAD